MQVLTIEDCLEHLLGYHAKAEDLPYELHEDNAKVIRSVAKQVYKGKALTEKQFKMCNKIMNDYYITEFHKNGIDITSHVTFVLKMRLYHVTTDPIYCTCYHSEQALLSRKI